MNRIAIIGIMVEDFSAVPEINRTLHDYEKYILGRMGLPHVKESLNVISVVIDAPNDVISALSGKLGRIKNVTSKALYSKNEYDA